MNAKIFLSSLAILPALGASALASTQYAVVNFEYVNVRTNPDINKGVSFILKKGDKVRILAENEGWTNIEYNNKNGWVQTNTLVIKQTSDTKTNYTLNDNIKIAYYENVSFRSEPDTKSRVLIELKKGQKLRVLEETSDWTKCEYEGQVGYVSSKMLIADKQLKNNEEVALEDSQMVNGISRSADINLETYKKTVDSYNSTGIEEYQAYLESEAKQDTMNSNSSLSFENKALDLKTANGTTTNILTVKSDRLYLRSNPTSLSKSLITLKKGDKVQYISNTNGWYKIKFNGLEGYASSYYLEGKINDSKNTPDGSVKYISMGMSLDQFVNMQMTDRRRNINTAISFQTYATKDDLMKIMNPRNFTDYAGMMQFAKLDQYTNCITATELNRYLSRYCPPGNVFYNKGQAFIDAARNNNINVLYLVAHSMVETGYGKSNLSRGIDYKGVKVYNLFGIGAVDGNARLGGAATAYKYGWTTIDKGIGGAAQWIANGYIHNQTYKQNTLYEMKWCKDYIWHQYATGIAWPSMIGKNMATIGTYSNSIKLMSYEVPQFR